MRNYLVVGAGGALGAVARYWLGTLFKIDAGGFPLGTFIINLTGSFGLGFFLTLITERYLLAAEWRLFFATGFVGAYTTFSSFTNEIISLFRQGYLATGLLYSLTSLLGGMLCVGLGLALARLIAFGHLSKTPQEEIIQARRETISQRQAEAAGFNLIGPLPAEERSELDPD